MTPRQVSTEKRRQRLSRDEISAAAIRLVERDGLDALTMRHLADELGCAPMSLYTHVRNRDDLVDAIVDRLIGELDVDEVPGDTWQQAIRRAFASYRDLAIRTPRSFELLALAPYDRSPVAEHLRRVVANLERAGLGAEQARQILGIADAYASGFLVVWARSRAAGDGAGADEDDAAAIGSLRSMEMFDRGLDALVAGLAATL